MKSLIYFSKIIGVFFMTVGITCSIFFLSLMILPMDNANVISFIISVLVTFTVGYLLFKRSRKINKTHVVATFLTFTVIGFFANGFIEPNVNFSKRETMRTWDLSSGSKLAYWEFKPNTEKEMMSTPIVFVHGGPGGSLRRYEENFLQKLANRGYHVYAYEQAGGGSSYQKGMDMKKLTMDYNIKDLLDIQTNILKSEKIILLGQSNGSTISTRYISEHPEKVEKFIAAEPGYFDADTSDNKSTDDYGKENAEEAYEDYIEEKPNQLKEFRNTINILSVSTLGRPIENTTEFLNYNGVHIGNIIAASFSKSDYKNIPKWETLDQKNDYLWINFLSNMHFTNNFIAENKNLTNSVKNFNGKVMVALGECSYIDRGTSREYFEKFKNTTNKYYRNVGHIIWGKNDDTAGKFVDDVDKFLKDNEVENDFTDYASLRKLDLN